MPSQGLEIVLIDDIPYYSPARTPIEIDQQKNSNLRLNCKNNFILKTLAFYILQATIVFRSRYHDEINGKSKFAVRLRKKKIYCKISLTLI